MELIKSNINKASVKELQQICREYKIKGFSKLRKAEAVARYTY